MQPALLLADVWELLVPAVIIVVYLISHLWGAAQSASKQQQRQQQPRPQGQNQQRRRQQPGEPADPRQPAAQREAKAGNQSQLNAEIEQFLKRAHQRRQDKSRGESAPRKNPSAPLQPVPVAAQVVETPSERRPFDSVAQSVSEHLDNRRFEQRAEHLADDIRRSQQEMTRHLEEAFDQRVGSLGSLGEPLGGSTQPAAGPSPEQAAQAKATAGLLVSPQNIRQAVLLKEILERPVDRW